MAIPTFTSGEERYCLLKLGVEVKGTEATLKGLELLMLKPEDLKRLLYSAGQQQVLNIKNAMAKPWQSQTDIDGIALPPSNRAVRQHGSTLVDTGAMLGAVGITELSEERVIVSEMAVREAEKAFKHQFGKGVKQRKWFGFRPGDMDKVMETVRGWLDKRWFG